LGKGKIMTISRPKHADYFVEDWRAMTVVCEKGEMKQVYLRAKKDQE